MTMKNYISVALVILLCCAACYLSGLRRGRRGVQGGANAKADTVVIYKTKTVAEPQFRTQTFQRWAFFTEEQRDTVRERELVPYAVHDTVYVPIVQRYYEELDGRLRLWISGYQPTLDRFELDERETYITKQKKWGFSVGVGPGIIYSPFAPLHVDAGIGIFGGLTYTF